MTLDAQIVALRKMSRGALGSRIASPVFRRQLARQLRVSTCAWCFEPPAFDFGVIFANVDNIMAMSMQDGSALYVGGTVGFSPTMEIGSVDYPAMTTWTPVDSTAAWGDFYRTPHGDYYVAATAEATLVLREWDETAVLSTGIARAGVFRSVYNPLDDAIYVFDMALPGPTPTSVYRIELPAVSAVEIADDLISTSNQQPIVSADGAVWFQGEDNSVPTFDVYRWSGGAGGSMTRTTSGALAVISATWDDRVIALDTNSGEQFELLGNLSRGRCVCDGFIGLGVFSLDFTTIPTFGGPLVRT